MDARGESGADGWEDALLEYTHHWLFVAASFAVALVAGFAGLALTRGASKLPTLTRQVVVAIAAVILGLGIWSMHFVAMLGLVLPVPYYYDPLITMISALTAILVMGLALVIVHFGERTRARIVLAGAITGLGIAAMHYLGMSGMELCAPQYTTLGVLTATVISVLLGIGSFLLCYGDRSARNILLGTLGFGIAVFSVHFTAMFFTQFRAIEDAVAIPLPMSRDVLAFGVTLSVFLLSGMSLLTGANFVARLRKSEEPHAPAPAPAPAADTQTTRLPYEADNRTRFVDASAVSALRAEGHYTILYVGDEKHFCPLSITEAEARIPMTQFMRTHRSYLVNLDHVTGFERRKDNGVCYFDNTPSLPKVPVARGRLKDVRERLGM